MSKKQDSYYFQSFIACTDYACQAASLLLEVMKNFQLESLPKQMDAMHQLEHAADMRKHELLNTLVKAFITPIEREDIIQISQNIDEITDKIEDVLIRIYYNHIQSIRPDALELAETVVKCCGEAKSLMDEFADFKHSKSLRDHIIRINTMEEEADKRYISCMYQLHGACRDPIEIIAWREIYNYLEKCADACEHVADMVESAVMKNS